MPNIAIFRSNRPPWLINTAIQRLLYRPLFDKCRIPSVACAPATLAADPGNHCRQKGGLGARNYALNQPAGIDGWIPWFYEFKRFRQSCSRRCDDGLQARAIFGLRSRLAGTALDLRLRLEAEPWGNPKRCRATLGSSLRYARTSPVALHNARCFRAAIL